MKTSTLRFSISRIMQAIAIAVVFAVAVPEMSASDTQGRPGANEQNRSHQDNRSRGIDRGRNGGGQTARPSQGGSQGQRPKATNSPVQNNRQGVTQSKATQNHPIQSQARPTQGQVRPTQNQNRPTQAQPAQPQTRPSQSQGQQTQNRPSSQTKPSQGQAQPQGPVPGQRPGANIGSSNSSSQRPGNGNKPGNGGNNKPGNQPGHNGGNGNGHNPGNGAPGHNWGNNNGHNPSPGGPGHNGGPGNNWGGPGHGPGHNPGPGGPGHNWGGHGPGGPHWGVPPRPHMPVPRPFAVPPRPHAWRPIGPMPTFTTILGMALGMTLDATLNYLFNGGYSILGYNDSMVYLSNVMMLNLAWPDATLYYTPNGLLQASEFVYSTMYPDYSRYNVAYNNLMRSYGSPVSLTSANGGMTATWFGNGNRFVTLSYMPQYSAGGILQYYTTLSFGI